jgi:transcriptional regulator with XRE-family HTH domain
VQAAGSARDGLFRLRRLNVLELRGPRESFQRTRAPEICPRCYHPAMVINERLRELREAKNLSQGDIEERTGLLRCYTSRVENGHTIPSLQTLEKYAGALGVPLYALFHEGKSSPGSLKLLEATEPAWGANKKETRELRLFAKAISRMNDRERRLLLYMASKLASRR